MHIQVRSYVQGISAKSLVAGACALCCVAAHADNLPLSLSISETLSRDNNLYRVEPGQYAIADTVSSTGLKLGLDKSYSRQRYVANIGTALNRYIDSTKLNNTSYDVNLGITSEFADKGLAQFNAGATQQLARFDIANGTNIEQTKNLQTTSSVSGQVQYGGYGAWSQYVNISHYQQGFTYTSPNYQTMNQNTVGLGTIYKIVPQLSVGLGARFTRGDINNDQGNGEILTDDMRRRDIDLTSNWVASGLSKLYARLGVSKTHDSYTNSFSSLTNATSKGWTGEINWDYTPQGRFEYNLTYIRDNGNIGRGYESGDSALRILAKNENNRSFNKLGGKLTWDVTYKIKLNAAFEYTKYRLIQTENGTIIQNGVESPTAGEQNGLSQSRYTQYSIGGKYEFARWLDLYCDIKRLKRTQDAEYRPYNATVTACTGQFNINGMN